MPHPMAISWTAAWASSQRPRLGPILEGGGFLSCISIDSKGKEGNAEAAKKKAELNEKNLVVCAL